MLEIENGPLNFPGKQLAQLMNFNHPDHTISLQFCANSTPSIAMLQPVQAQQDLIKATEVHHVNCIAGILDI